MNDWLTQTFEKNRPHLRAVAYRMLGSLSEADDAVQETWLRLNRSETGTIDNLNGWLTTVIARVCLDVLRSRNARREEPLDTHVPDLIVSREDGMDPEHEALIADSVGIALLVVLETLAPPERLAFVLHDMFAVPFDEIASIVGCSNVAARQLASRARRKVQGTTTFSAWPQAWNATRNRQILSEAKGLRHRFTERFMAWKQLTTYKLQQLALRSH
jgi:RNA polymerase sigma-70 factor (ECF subfamily)